MLIDIHVHMTPRKTVRRVEDDSTFTTPEELMAMMDRAGIDQAVVLPPIGPECSTRSHSNEEILAACALYPHRFIPFCNLDPRMVSNSPSADFSGLLEYYSSIGCKGVGEICANMYFDDPRVINLLRQCAAYGMPVTFHIGPQIGGCYGLVTELGLGRLETVLDELPDLILLGHSQPFWSEIAPDVTEETRNGYPSGPVAEGGRVPELMRKYPNLYGDLSAGSGYNAVSRDPAFGYRFMEEFQDRLLFGTDICAPHNETPLVAFLEDAGREGKISRDAYEKIAWRNADRLLGLGLTD